MGINNKKMKNNGKVQTHANKNAQDGMHARCVKDQNGTCCQLGEPGVVAGIVLVRSWIMIRVVRIRLCRKCKNTCKMKERTG